MLNRPMEMLRQYGSGVGRVLDYGSGPAPVLVELLRQAGYDAAGYDPIFAAGTDITGPFDAVVAVETFEHFAEPRRELERIAGLLRPGGLLIIITLLHNGPAAMRDWWYARDATHVAFYSTATLAWIAGAFGFELVQCDNERLAVLRRTT
jgi:cyclopropane fatty-acyl-phospholipid synthase-like methyltransferase